MISWIQSISSVVVERLDTKYNQKKEEKKRYNIASVVWTFHGNKL